MIVSDLGYPFVGGNERYVIELGSKLVELGHKVYWLTSMLPHTKSYDIYKGINIYRVPIPFSKHYIFPGRQCFPVAGLLPIMKLAVTMDILQFNTFIAGTLGWIGRSLKKPTILFCHEMFSELWWLIGQNLLEKNIYLLIEKYIAHLPYSWFIVPSEYSKRTLIKAGAQKDKITVIPHGINFNLFNPKISGESLKKQYKLEGKKIVGFTGRLSIKGTGQAKNLTLLLKAMKYVVNETQDARLVLGGSNFSQIKDYIAKENLGNYVLYLGQRPYDKVGEFIAMCDVIVCPALADGFCFLLAEASACGKPVVATRRASHMERVIDKRTGVLTETTPEDLAENIVKLLLNEKLAGRYGVEGVKYAQKFTWGLSAKKHLEIYNKLLETVTNKN